MQRFARVDGRLVAEIIEIADGLTLGVDIHHPDLAAQCRSCGIEVEQGWLWDGEVFTAPVPAALTKADLLAYAADIRWQAEQGGAIWNGWPIHTDDRSQGKYLSELQAIALNVRVEGDPWKFADGVFRPVSNADFPALAIKAREHVRTFFGIEGVVQAQIEAGTFTTREQIADAFSSL